MSGEGFLIGNGILMGMLAMAARTFFIWAFHTRHSLAERTTDNDRAIMTAIRMTLAEVTVILVLAVCLVPVGTVHGGYDAASVMERLIMGHEVMVSGSFFQLHSPKALFLFSLAEGLVAGGILKELVRMAIHCFSECQKGGTDGNR